MPLRKPQEYREDSRDILHWLSRRWLYNIPRSAQTEGLRPLGRLAQVDHASQLFERLGEAVAKVTDPESLQRTAETTGLKFREQVPRVFVVASISGGTGSGMVLDVVYVLRKILADHGISDAGLCSILTHSTHRKPAARDLAIANAYACLDELHHYIRSGRYPGEPSCGLPPFEGAAAAFPNTYLVHLGDEMNANQFDNATDALAHYLYVDTATAGGVFLDKCRDLSRTGQPPAASGMTLRTLGLCQIGCTQSGVPAMAAELLCKKVVDGWRGSGDTNPGVLDAKLSEPPNQDETSRERRANDDVDIHQLVTGGATTLGLTLETLVQRMKQLAEEQFATDAETHFRTAVSEALSKHNAEQADGGQGLDPARLLSAVQGLFEPRQTDGKTLLASSGGLVQVLTESLKASSTTEADAVRRWILELVDVRHARMQGAFRAIELFVQHFRSVEENGMESLRQVQKDLDAIVQSLQDAKPAERRRPKFRLGIGGSGKAARDLNKRLLRYALLRFDEISLRAVCELAKSIASRVAKMSDQLTDLRRQLGQVSEQFDVPDAWNDEDDDRGNLSQTFSQIRVSVVEAIQSRMPELVETLDRDFQSGFLDQKGGLCGAFGKDSRLIKSLTAELRAEARTLVLRAMQGVDIAEIVLQTDDEPQQVEDRLQACLDAAKPRLLSCGGAQRLLLQMPDSPAATRLQEVVEKDLGQSCTRLVNSDGDLVLCYEAEQLSLPRAAMALIGNRRDFADIAGRLRTRVDVDWTSLADSQSIS